MNHQVAFLIRCWISILGLALGLILFLLLRLACAIVWRIRKLSPPRVLGEADAVALVLIPFAWSAIGAVTQNYNNAREWFFIDGLWCLCLLSRYLLASRNSARRPGAGAIPTLAVLLALVFFFTLSP